MFKIKNVQSGGVKKMKKFLAFFLLGFIMFSSTLNAQDRASQEYIIEKGDTLWGISDSELEDTFLWPKLWNVNPHIENPDLIYPGRMIIIPSREELMRMPALPAKKLPVAKKQETAASKPKSVWKYAPILKKTHIIDRDLYIASGWIADRFPSIGRITSSTLDKQMVSKDDIVYIKLNEEAKYENRLFAIRDIKIVKHPVTGKKIGHQIRVAGILEVIGEDNNITKAKIVDSFEDVQIGDGLLPYREMEAPLIPDSVRKPAIEGYIIESHMNSYLLGEGNVIFLDKGENDGIEVGDVFTVVAEKPTERAIGTLQVVSLQPATSGAVLLQSEHEVTIGRKWGQK